MGGDRHNVQSGDMEGSNKREGENSPGISLDVSFCWESSMPTPSIIDFPCLQYSSLGGGARLMKTLGLRVFDAIDILPLYGHGNTPSYLRQFHDSRKQHIENDERTSGKAKNVG